MAIIPLRAYNREIEGMIDNGQLDEAVAHCRHILATFPKHIASYRLLGKAHLEQQRISDATDIFQRVLSTVPDDFIANVGMSIIREDENNLDASIWHMELAYEAQPSNIAIQDELRRLYGRRDGMQPPKVRLTRGALARMYAKGGLFDQAIAELRAAITEDPNRPDLQLLLAEMFYQTSQGVEAVETCVNVLKKLPYCLAANQILAACLPEAERSEKSRNYRQIAISMDPYFAFAAAEAVSSDQVPENAVNIEKLEWKSGIQINGVTAQPTWATSLGISLEKPAEEKLPEWLKGTEAPSPSEPDEKAQSAVSPFIWDTQEVEKIITDAPKQEGEIPDWMKDAGWKPGTGESPQEPVEAINQAASTADSQPEELEKADIPDWLRGIAPEGVLEETTPDSQAKEKEVSSPWLEKQQPGPTDSIIQWLEEKKPDAPETPPESGGIPSDVIDEEIPEWLKDLDVPHPASTQVEQPSEEAETPPITPAFIEEPVITEPSETVESKAIALEETPAPDESIEPVLDVGETQFGADFSEPGELAAGSTEELPDWIKELAGEVPEITPSAPAGEEEIAEPPASIEVESIAETQQVTEEGSAEELPVTMMEEPVEEDQVPAEEIPSMEIKAVEGLGVSEPFVSDEIPAAEVPTLAEEHIRFEEPLAPEGEVIAEVPISSDEAEISTRLESFAIRKDEEEQEQITMPEELKATPLEWVKLEAEAAMEETIPELESQAEEASTLPSDEIPEWIKGLGETPEIETVPTEPVSETLPEPEALQPAELPAWLQELEQPEEQKESLITPQEALEWKEAELPDWIKEITESAPSEEVPAAVEPPLPEELPIVSEEAVSNWSSEGGSIAEDGEGETVKPQKLAEVWVQEVEEPIQPVTAEPAGVEEEPVEVSEELVAEGIEATATTPSEPLVEPVVEAPQSELALQDARNAISQGLPTQAAEVYSGLIQQNQHLDEVIKDLQDALYRYPVDISLWVSLGDAFFHTNQLQEALNSYTKAEDLVR